MGLLTSKDTDGNVDFSADFHFPASNKALIIFTRTPQLGKCKTRLASAIGDEAALEVYKILLNHTAKITEKVTADKFVFYAGTIAQHDAWNNEIFSKKLQIDGDLGVKMHHAFLELFELGYEKVVIVGSDLFDLTSREIDDAFTALAHNDTVIGPAEDGGYYLLGMKTLNTAIFENKDWGTATVLQDTLKDLKAKSVFRLPAKNDIDHVEDIMNIDVFQQFIPDKLLKRSK